MITFSPPPPWLPSLVQPADWFIIRIGGVMLFISFIFGVASFLKGGESDGKSL